MTAQEEKSAFNEVRNKRYDAQADLSESFSDDSVETDISEREKHLAIVQQKPGDLYSYTKEYHPHSIDLKPKLICFMPEFIPAIGEPQAGLLSVPFGFQKTFNIFDEPCLNQSTPTEIHTKLEGHYHQDKENSTVEVIDACNIDRGIEEWIDEVKRHNPKGFRNDHEVTYVEKIMSPWNDGTFKNNPDIKENIKTLLKPSIDVSLQEYILLCSAVLGIPISKGNNNKLIQALQSIFHAYYYLKTDRQASGSN